MDQKLTSSYTVNIRIVLLVIFVLLLVLGFLYVWVYGKSNEGNGSGKIVTSFEECMNAGNPVMESYPRRCRTSDGREFTERVNTPDVPFQPPADSNLGGVCNNLCGDGVCQEMVCQAIGCPCSESVESCPVDCVGS